MKFISQPPPMLPPPMPPPARPAAAAATAADSANKKKARVGRVPNSVPISPSLFLSTVLPKRDEADSLRAPLRRGGGGSNFWIEREAGDLL